LHGKEAAVLILTRKAEQGIVIDGRITVRVLAVEGERVKLGIDAPVSVGVLREELVQQISGANREAARPGQGEQLVRRLRDLGPRKPGLPGDLPHPR
jgi:carbon storage regulator